MTTSPAAITYTIFVLRENVRIVIFITALNALEVNAGGALNAYITSRVNKKFRHVLAGYFELRMVPNQVLQVPFMD